MTVAVPAVERPHFFHADYEILITDETLQVVGDPIDAWINLDCTLRWNEPGSGLFSAVAHTYVTDQLAAGNRVVVIRRPDPQFGIPAGILLSGPIERWIHEIADNGENARPGVVTVTFADDLAKVVARRAYPNPAQDANAQTVDYWPFTGNSELALRALVDANAGPGALPYRRIPQLVLGATAGVGTSVAVSADRMQPLGELMRSIAELGGGIGFRTRQVGDQIVFECYTSRDRSDIARFGFNFGNVKYMAWEVSAPTATSAIVGGQGTGGDRAMIERTNTGNEVAWGRYETLVSRAGTTAAAELTDEGDKALAQGAATTRLPASVADNDGCRFGIDYTLGDKVAIEITSNKDYADIVKTVHLQAWPAAGEMVASTIGSQEARTNPVWSKKLREVEQRLNKLERIAVTVPKP